MKTLYRAVPQRLRARAFRTAGALVLLVTPSLAQAAEPAQATPPATAPSIEMQRLPNGRVVVAVTEGGVSIRKDVSGMSSHVLVTTPTDTLQIRVDANGLTVSTPSTTVTTAEDGSGGVGVKDVLERSTAAAAARALLRRLPAAPDHFGYQSLLLTRAVLELGSGTRDTLKQWAEASPRKGGRPAVIKTAQGAKGDRTAGECLDTYTKDAIALYQDYLDCLGDVRWYEFHKQLACATVYTFKAELAMMWVVNCVGGFPFGGN